jgi:hypothetical protein
MENHTKRIRKSRREGFQSTSKELAPPRPSRSRVRRTPSAVLDVPGTRRANARKKSLTTTRKTKRQRPAGTRRAMARAG